ncbi:hypothetical protein PVAND_002563 [Polypedilum vanderplanki]|uniref:EGF-like domain-containing protein n=1 Tax=Polypedilum vanderplanki TaxID=319348 RepID=A0A9J6BSJ1_POLVA|nr:hypothetical protein PVAND_002563 [Polypedilum vanderplanki]
MKRYSLSNLNVGLQFFIDQVSDFRKKNFNIQKTLNASSRSSSKVTASAFLIVLIFSAICDVTDACRSRTVYKPRTTQAPTTSPRPNITFHTYKCPEAYANWYCLNGATCFAVKIGMEVLYNCECKDGYIGPRCDYKDLDGSYLSARSRVMLETASIAGGAVAALLLACIVGIFVYLKKHTTKPCEFEVESQKPNHKNCNECQKF